MTTTRALYDINNLAVGYGTTPLFKELNLSLRRGELVCFMGPNGCGKSTLIRTMAGLQHALSGALPPKSERQVAVVLTDRVHSKHMTVRELVTYGRYPYLGWNLALSDRDRTLIDQSIALVRIESLLDHTLDELSDGQAQMVMIARALAQDTPILLLDEPTAHLDLNNRIEVMNLLRRLSREQGKAILLATHELDLALQTADVVWLANGSSIQVGIPEDLVLNGAFDQVFQFKGYDLKTGKVQHEVFQNQTIRLVGSDFVYLWTKNALERNGFSVGAEGSIEVRVENGKWLFAEKQFDTIEKLVDDLKFRI